jgi:hypothetical protein
MKKSLFILLAALGFASAAIASDAAQTASHKTYIATNRAALCSLPSGKTTRQCAHAASNTGAGAHPSPYRRFAPAR